jgi:hypothetical protein
MPNYHTIPTLCAPVDKWIKNVYSLRTGTGTTSDDLPTPSSLSQQFTHAPVHKPRLVPLLVQVFTAQLSTVKNAHFNLLHSRLYPQSTAPINKKKKGNMERNT